MARTIIVRQAMTIFVRVGIETIIRGFKIFFAIS